jgi:hypothetical protein
MGAQLPTRPGLLSRLFRNRWFWVAFSLVWLMSVVAISYSSLHWTWKVLACVLLGVAAPSLQDIVSDFRKSRREARSAQSHGEEPGT